jgi:hypothetical protein
MAHRCRPPYEEQNARISILVNGIAERPDTFVQTVLGQCKNYLPTGRAIRFPPAAERCAFDVRGVDHLRGSGSPPPSKLPEQVFPDAAPRPAHKAVIDHCRRTIFGRAIAPAADLLSTCTMPLITRRSSTRSTPRTSVGRRGLTRDRCSSLSQSKFLRTIPVPLSKFEPGSYCQHANEF